jgi:2-phospho-L-lactate/phosphoenolpyruvate guanylyltransferase
MAADIWAAVPVKEFTGAKQRLASFLTPEQRRALAAAMLEDVLAALAGAPLAGIMVNTLEPIAVDLARRYGARVVTDDARSGHTGAVTAMARILAEEGHEGMLTVPGDIPRVTASEIGTVLEARRSASSLTIVPARDERGSNAMLLSPPLVMPLRFGDDSFLPHLATARGLGIEPTIVKLPGIGLDIDQPEDVAAFMRAEPRMATRALTLLTETVGGAPSPTLPRA